MDVNPYESPGPPEEQVAFREVAAVWGGWRRMREIGMVLAAVSVCDSSGLSDTGGAVDYAAVAGA